MSKSKLNAAALADVCARLLNGESRTSITKRWGIGGTTMNSMTETLRRHGLKVEARPAPRFDANREDELHRLFRTTTRSNREISATTGIPLSTVNGSRRRFNLEVVKSGEELPRCECGQYLHHARLCWARHRQNMKNAGIASVRTLAPEVAEDVRRRLLRGETMRSIAERVSLKKEQIHSFLRTFTAEERQQRELAFRTSAGRRRARALARKIARPHATNPSSDPLYARISAAVPRGIDPALRDDMISQAYLEVLEGQLKEDRLAEGVKKVRGRIFQAFANPWGNVSLDAALGDDDARAIVESIPAGTSAFA